MTPSAVNAIALPVERKIGARKVRLYISFSRATLCGRPCMALLVDFFRWLEDIGKLPHVLAFAFPVCEQGTFGKKCRGRCDCHPGVRCHPVSGRCICPKGRTGNKCDKVALILPFENQAL